MCIGHSVVKEGKSVAMPGEHCQFFSKGNFPLWNGFTFSHFVQLVVGWPVSGHPLFPRVVSLAGLHFRLCGKEKMD